MSTKQLERVTVDFDEESYYLDGEYWESWDNFGEEMADAINDLLNKQDKEIEVLKECCRLQKEVIEDCEKLFYKYGVDTFNLRVVEELFKSSDFFYDMCKQYEKEIHELRQQMERYKRLNEIHEEEINNRILTIKEFIDDYSDDYEIKKVLLDLFHSEVKEYDLSKKYRDLKKENEKLGKELENYKLMIKEYLK